MILSFIEGTIITKKPAAIQTGRNPFRELPKRETPETKEQLLLSVKTYGDKPNKKDETADLNNDTMTKSDDSRNDESKIIDFRNTESELTNEVSVDLDKSNTSTEKAMTMNSAEMDAFRRKYDELMKQLEKERFERELIARSR